jgi:molybdopterin synthase sulfur carrier subunit
MATVVIPLLMRDLTQGKARVEVPGRTVRDVIAALDERYPGVRARLCEGDALAGTLAVVIDGKLSRRGLYQRVVDESEIRFVPAIEGG